MANKNQNDILAAQRKARKEYLELKKMQEEGKTEEKASNEKLLPKTPKEKLKNFWDYYKWTVVACIIAAIVIAVSVRQCATATKYDFGILAFAKTSVSAETLEAVADYVSQNCEDVTGDGVVNISIQNCTFDPKTEKGDYQSAIMQKVQLALSSDYELLLVLTDDFGYDYIMGEDGLNEGMFVEEPCALSEKLLEELAKEGVNVPKELQVSLRKYEGTWFEDKKNIEGMFEQAEKAYENLKQ